MPIADSSAVIERNAHRLTDRHILVAGLEQSTILSPLRDVAASVHAMTLFKSIADASTGSNTPTEFGLSDRQASDMTSVPYDVVIVLISKSKALNALLVHWAASQAESESELWLVGHNKAGIKSQSALLSDYCEAVSKLDSARHCVIYTGSDIRVPEFSLVDYQQQVPIQSQGHAFDVISYPGVFAHGRLDQGTALLLESQALPQAGRLLDFGCGCGVLGAYLTHAHGHACTIDAVDHDAMAIRACTDTYALNGVQGHVVASNGLEAITERYDAVITNPPFHQGIATTTDTTHRFLDSVNDRLVSGGSLIMVANRHLDYPERLKRHFRMTETVMQTGTYQVTRSVS